MGDLAWWANVSQIITGVLAIGTIAVYQWGMWSKQRELEKYLKAEKDGGGDKGQRTVLHLMAHLGLTEDELLRASFRSGVIKRALAWDINGKATHILFEYMPNSS